MTTTTRVTGRSRAPRGGLPPPDRAREPHAIGGLLAIDTLYGYEPLPRELDASQARHVLGAQARLDALDVAYRREP